ncbi:membrane dipeptidase [Mesobacillus campisalis]|uniref:Membrane dipeptidase n=1 Tax=Mesobacillus campisalis TaxID=1408103 RepID=A0A0M2SRB8_9BACI|nr:dipeptidase [Mesobacillus campisalis]KKK36703.1 membrane dipeptidase [Mesobacillus campisalis]
MKKLFSVALTSALLLSAVLPASQAVTAKQLSARDIHFNTTVVDSHNDTMMKAVNPVTWLPETDIGGNTDFHIDIPKLQAGGLNVPFFAAYTSGYYGNNPRSISRTLALINALYWTEERNSDVLEITSSLKEIEKARREGKIAAVPTVEGAYSLEEHNAIELLHQYYDLGIRALGFTWNYSNALGEGANRVYGDTARTPSPAGLTVLGKEVAQEMNKLGMLIDVSHLSEQSFWDVIEVSKAPIMATHSGTSSLREHARNLTDEQLKALAENGGVVGIVFYPDFLKYGYPAENVYIKDYVDHIDHAVKVAGIDHVALGSDFDGGPLPTDIKDASELYKVTEELVNRGYSQGDIEKLLGKNTLRLLKEVERAAEHDAANVGQGLAILPSLKMGETVPGNTPLLTAKVERTNGAPLDESSLRVIVDGIAYKPNYDSATSTMSIQLTQPLKEKFHVVTFEAANTAGKIEKETRIFYINQ